jgi:DNA polymerase-3 subunit beta
MKATFSRPILASGITVTQSTVSSSSTLPILANVLFESDSKGVNLIATDLECFSKVRLDARVEEAGRVTAPAKTLSDIVRSLPDDDIALATTGSRMTLTCNRNVFHLSTMSADDFPEWPSFEPQTRITIRQADLRRLLRNTLFAQPQRDPRKVLMGTLFELKAGKLTCVSTDGRKLGKAATEPSEVRGKEEFNAIIPGRVLAEIDRVLGEEGEVEIGLSDQRAVITLGNLNLTYLTTLIDGKFPNYSAVIPESFKRTLELPKQQLSEAINRAAILAERKHHSIVLSFGNNSIGVKAQSFEDGSYEGEVAIDYDGEPFKIAFNYHYLHDVLRIAPDAKIKMKVKESIAPVVFECDSDPESLYLVMPVRIHDLEGEEAEPAGVGAEEE